MFEAKSTILCMSRPARVWLFSAGLTGLCEFRPTQCIGDGHAMGWRAGVEFTMMEKSVRAEFSASGRSFPPYGTGNNHNTWYAATMVDAEGREIPYVDRDGNELSSVSQRYRPVPGQKFFLKGGSVDNAKYAYRGPETLPADEILRRGYKLPLYADLSKMPEMERKVIWGMMIGQEGKTQVPILQNFTDLGYNPDQNRLQSYGIGWTSADFLPQERQLFGLPGGVLNDWDLKTNMEGLYAAGDQLFASNCFGHAASTGSYAGRHAADYALTADVPVVDRTQVEKEKARVYQPLEASTQEGIGWKELNMGLSKLMQIYCGETKRDDLLQIGLRLIQEYQTSTVPMTYARNPHELTRTLEVFDILTVSEIILRSCLARKSSSRALSFSRAECPELDPPQDHKFITIRQMDGNVVLGELPLDYFGPLKENYEKHNQNYCEGVNA